MPRYGPARVAAIEGLEAAIADDCWKTLAAMVRDGWDPHQAAQSYEAWLTEIVSAGVANALRCWREGAAA